MAPEEHLSIWVRECKSNSFISLKGMNQGSLSIAAEWCASREKCLINLFFINTDEKASLPLRDGRWTNPQYNAILWDLDSSFKL